MGLKLYLLRHGHSPTAAEAGVDSDAERPLSERGRAGVRKTVGELLARGGKPALVLHSPLTRAAQTAEVAEGLIHAPKGRRAFDPLANVLPPNELADALAPELDAARELLAVGHQPQLGELAALLSGQVFELKPGGLIALELGGSARAAALWSCNPGDLS